MRSPKLWLWLALLPAVASAAPSITSLSYDASRPTGNANVINAVPAVVFPLYISGSGFTHGSYARWGSTILSTQFSSSVLLIATVTPDLRAISGNYPITVLNPDLSVSNVFPMVVSPVLGSATPNTAMVGSPTLIQVTGGGFTNGLAVKFQLTSSSAAVMVPATVTSDTTLTAVIPANALTSPQTAHIWIVNTGADPSGGNISADSVPIYVHNQAAIAAASPNPIDAGGVGFPLDVTGSGFSPASVVQWAGAPLVTVYLSPTELLATITPDLRQLAGAFPLTVTDSSTGATSGGFSEIVSPVLFAIGPASAAGGAAPVTITATGVGFTSNTGLNITVSGQAARLATTYVSSTTLTAVIPASALRTAGSLLVQAVDGSGGHSLTQTFTVTQAAPSIASLAPNSATAGAPGFTLTVNGSNFVSGAGVQWNGAALTTTFVSSSQLTAAVPASLVQTAGTAGVTVAISGAPASAAFSFTINPPPPTLSAIAPQFAFAASPSFTLTITGTNCGAGCTVQWNGQPLATTVLNSGQVSAWVPSVLIASAGTATIRLAAPGGALSNTASFVINPPAPTLISLSPSPVTSGSAPASLSVTGLNFAPGAVVLWNGMPLATTFASATLLTATVSGSLVGGLSATVTVTNPGGAVSNSLTVSIAAPQPAIASIAPASAAAGTGPLTVAVTGRNFAVNCVVRWNGTPLYTTLVSGTEADATVPADLLANPGPVTVTVANPSGLESAAAAFTILTPLPAVSGIDPASAPAGAPGINLTVSGSSFLATSKVLWNGTPLPTTFVDSTRLKADVAAVLVAAPGMASVTVATPGVTPPNAVVFTVGNPVPATSTAGIMSAASGLAAIAPGSLISIYGTNLAPANAAAGSMPLPASLAGTSVTINGMAAPVLFVSAGQINVQVPYEAPPGTATLTVQSGSLTSAPVSFAVQAVAPGILPVVLDAVTGTLISQQTPARAGQYLTVYVTGQGAVDPPVATGAAAPADPFAFPVAAVTAQTGGVDAMVTFAGMAPGLAGLLQVNLQVPEAGAGNLPLVITVGGVASNPVTVPVAP